MADEENENRIRRMDLNLYLGLPRSPPRRESDLGSDLALGSMTLSGDEREASDSHTPYSPSNASYAPNPQPQVYSRHSLSGPSYVPLSSSDQIHNSPSVHNGTSRLEYCPYSPSYVPVPPTDQTGHESLGQEIANDYGEHVPYSPVLPTAEDSGDPIVSHEFLGQEDASDHIGHVPYLQFDDPVTPTVQDTDDHMVGSESLGQEDVVDRMLIFPYPRFFPPVTLTLQNSNDPPVHDGTSNHSEYVPSSPSHVPVLLPGQINGTLEHDWDNHIRYSPSFSLYRPTHQASETEVMNDFPQQDPLQFPEACFRRLIESHRRWWRARRLRSMVPHSGTPESNVSSVGVGHVFHDTIMASERPVETSGNYHRETEKSLVAEDSEEETKEGAGSTANFDCNVCLDVAKEPVVTSCGHLFCWPCLYQWLHLHCDHKECPVCKGEVTKSNIIPIYGRGSSETDVERKSVEDGDSNLKIPPRPRGLRFESLRQRICRPLSRRSREEISTWRRITNEEIQNRVRVQERRGMPGNTNGSNSVVTSLRRMQREDNLEYTLNYGGSGSSRNTGEVASNGQSGNLHLEGVVGGSRSSSHSRDEISLWQRPYLSTLPSTDRRDGIAASLSSVMGRVTNIGSHSGASASVNLQNTEILFGQGTRGAMPTADQTSVSSTAAMILGDFGLSDASAEPNSGGSSRNLRRRRNGVSDSLDVNGGFHNSRKRRRLD